MREKSYVEDIDRSIYDFKDDEKDAYKVKAGLTPEIVQKISDEKKDPAWMQLFRLRSLQIYNQMPIPDWGPSIEGLNMDDIVTYVRPNTKMKAKWSSLPNSEEFTAHCTRTGAIRQIFRRNFPENAAKIPEFLFSSAEKCAILSGEF